MIHPLGSGQSPLEQLSEGPIFVVGMARSGTSWVYDILRSHPLVAGVYESGLFDSTAGLAELLGDKYWGSGNAGIRELMTREQLAQEIGFFAGRVLGRALGPQHRYLVEKTPGHLWMIPVIGEVFPDARFIHVVRDGRDVYASIRAAKRSWATGWRKWRFFLPVFARRWKRAIRHVARVGALQGDRFLEGRYEEMRAAPFTSYRRLFDFCHIPYDEEILGRIHEVTNFEARRRSDGSGFVRGGRVGDWRTELNFMEGLIFNLIAGGGLIEAGYERSRWWRAPLRRKIRPLKQRAESGLAADRGSPPVIGS